MRCALQCVPNRLYIGSGAPSPPALSVAAAATAAAPVSSLGDRIKATVDQLTTGGSEDSANVSAAFDGLPWRAEVDFLNDELNTHTMLEDRVTIRTSGVYSMWFVTCDPKLSEVRATAAELGVMQRGLAQHASDM